MSMKRPWMVALLVVACCYGSLALAELTPVDPKTRQDIVFQILAQIANRVTSWEAQVTSAASYLFWTLGTISLSWTMGMMILKRADLGEFFSEFIRFIFFFGLFYALLRQGPNLARLILESMLQLGQETAGSTIKYQSFISIGTELMSRADQFQQTGAAKEDSMLVVGLCGAILLMLTTMVINLFLVFVAGWFLMYAGIFFLGFGGSRWTSDIAIGYYKAVIAVGMQMFVMALIMGIATDVLGDFFEKFSFEMRFYELMSFLVATFAFMTIFNRIPTLLSGLISGANIGISQGELGGALRGANGADPFSAGRAALGTAVGGAQKLMAAMSAGGNQASAETQIPRIAQTTAETSSLRTGVVSAAAGMLPGKASETLASSTPRGTAGGSGQTSPLAALKNPSEDTKVAGKATPKAAAGAVEPTAIDGSKPTKNATTNPAGEPPTSEMLAGAPQETIDTNLSSGAQSDNGASAPAPTSVVAAPAPASPAPPLVTSTSSSAGAEGNATRSNPEATMTTKTTPGNQTLETTPAPGVGESESQSLATLV